jgi:hypothetical protein
MAALTTGFGCEVVGSNISSNFHRDVNDIKTCHKHPADHHHPYHCHPFLLIMSSSLRRLIITDGIVTREALVGGSGMPICTILP